MMCGSKANIEARYIDQDKIISSKEKVKDGFVSTNDILTSSFARATKVDILLMAINLRNRVKGTNEKDAGNYESVILHDSTSASTPQALRKTLTGGAPFKRDGNMALPGFFKTTRSKVALITNWSFPDVWKANLKLFDSSGAKTIPIALHLPVYNIKDIAFPLGIIFRAIPDRLAIMYGGSTRGITYDKLIDAGCPIAERQLVQKCFLLDEIIRSMPIQYKIIVLSITITDKVTISFAVTMTQSTGHYRQRLHDTYNEMDHLHKSIQQ